MATRRYYILACAAILALVVVSAVTGDTAIKAEATDQEILSILAQGTALSASAVVSGAGTVRYHYLRQFESGYVSETTTTYKVAFKGGRWRISAEGNSVKAGESSAGSGQITQPGTGTPFHYEFACDGTQVVFYIPGEKNAEIIDLRSDKVSVAKTIYQSSEDDVTMIGKGIGPISEEIPHWKSEGWQIVGKQTVGGSECIKIQKTSSPEDVGGPLAGLSVTSIICVDSNKGFMWPESTVFVTSPSVGNSVLTRRKLVGAETFCRGDMGSRKVCGRAV